MPSLAQASVLQDILASLKGNTPEHVVPTTSSNLQTMAILKPVMNFDPSSARGGGDITIVDDSALMPDEGPSGTIADIDGPKNATISVYVVRPGDTLSGIGKMFGVSPNTILWANDLSKASALQVGQTLTILPINGVRHIVKKGDTLASIAKRYGGDVSEIASYNGLDDTKELIVGTEVTIPDGEIAAVTPSSTTKRSSGVSINEPAHNVGPQGTPDQIGYYLRPIVGGVRTQGVHGYNAVDLAAPVGTPILASAEGDVIVARDEGWNGGYGDYIVIQHDNGSQTLYGHASRVIVHAGQHVRQGQVIGYVGSTGKSTGSHVHFEIRNGIRNPF